MIIHFPNDADYFVGPGLWPDRRREPANLESMLRRVAIWRDEKDARPQYRRMCPRGVPHIYHRKKGD